MICLCESVNAIPYVTPLVHVICTWQVMFELQQVFGSLIPNVEFVIATSDRPMVALRSPKPYLPVFRCGVLSVGLLGRGCLCAQG
jgi:hypothetical protein